MHRMLYLSFLSPSLPTCTDSQKVNLVVGYHFLLRNQEGVNCELCYLPEHMSDTSWRVCQRSLRPAVLSQNWGRDIWRYLETFWLSHLEKCYWSLVGRGQEYCWKSYNVQGQLPQQRATWPQTSAVPTLENTDLGCQLSLLLLIHMDNKSRIYVWWF